WPAGGPEVYCGRGCSAWWSCTTFLQGVLPLRGPASWDGRPPRRRISVSLTLSVPAAESPGASAAVGHLPASAVADGFQTLDGRERGERRHSRQRRVRSLALHHVVRVHEHHADAVVLEAGQRLGEHGPGHRVDLIDPPQVEDEGVRARPRLVHGPDDVLRTAPLDE